MEKEIEKGKIRKIYALKLGYCVYFSDEGENIYTIYPVWMCECDYTESAKEELKKSEQIPDERKQYYYKQLVINAQTGQIEPYLIKNKSRLLPTNYHMGIIKVSLKSIQNEIRVEKGDFTISLGEEGGISCKIKKKGGRFQWLMKKVDTKNDPCKQAGKLRR